MKKYACILFFFSFFLCFADTQAQNANSYEFLLKWGTIGNADGQFFHPRSIAVDANNNIYVADSENHRIQKFNSNGDFILKWGNYGTGDGEFWHPRGIAVSSQGYVYVTDDMLCRVQKFDLNGNFVLKWGTYSGKPELFQCPRGVDTDLEGNVYVADSVSYYPIKKFDSSGNFISWWGCPIYGNQWWCPFAMGVDINGFVYTAPTLVADSILKYDLEGNFLNAWENLGNGFLGIDIDELGSVYTIDGNMRVLKLDANGNIISMFGESGHGDGQFYYPMDLAVDSLGDIYVADTQNHRIQKFGPSYIDVVIDIKPNSYPNTINLGSNGRVPVAIISSNDFDATKVDPLTISLAGASVSLRGRGTPMSSFEDINNDGLLDIVVHVDTSALQLSPSDSEVILYGATFSGVKIRGVDTVRIVPE